MNDLQTPKSREQVVFHQVLQGIMIDWDNQMVAYGDDPDSDQVFLFAYHEDDNQVYTDGYLCQSLFDPFSPLFNRMLDELTDNGYFFEPVGMGVIAIYES